VIGALIAWSARNAPLVLITTVAVALFGLWAVAHTPLDAIPDLSDTQVIVATDFMGQAPQVVEDQVTYPLATALLSVPRSKVVRGFSDFGMSLVYVVFEDGTDLYWARSRVLEYLNSVQHRLPAGVVPSLGPDATGVGWVFQYVVEGAQRSLAELRSLQDWVLRFQLVKADGVAEIASLGGFEKQYQVVVDPRKLQALGITLMQVTDAVRQSNRDVGGRSIELSETEYMVRGKGYLHGIGDLENIVLNAGTGSNLPVLLKDVARIELGPEERRGIADLDGTHEAVGGIVVKRDGADALTTIRAVKDRIAELLPSLPEGVSIRTVYDRSELIGRAIANLKRTLIEESLIVALVCAVFLLHARSALVAILTLPLGILIAFAGMNLLGIGSNIMSLGGIAIALGAMVDAAIVMIENAHKHIERLPPGAPRGPALIEAAREVGPSLFFSLLVITVSFLPVFTLEAQEGRLFKPLAFTKTFAMAGGALLSVTLVPVLMLALIRGRIVPELRNPLSRALIAAYRPAIRLVLRRPAATVLIAAVILAVTAWPASRLGSEFMPELNEGSLFYMPVTPPGISVTKAAELLQIQDRIIRSFPEVESVFGKSGHAATATDPAPLEMFETIINLKPESAWRPGMTQEKLVAEMDAALKLPGVSNSWTMPIKARIDMLSTGISSPVGVKVFGPDLREIARITTEIERVVRGIPGTTSAYAERIDGGHYLEIIPDRDAIARYGFSVNDVQDVIDTAIGGMKMTTTVEGRERYGVLVRYPRELRDTPEAIAREVLVPTMSGAMGAGGMGMGMDGMETAETGAGTLIPLGQLAAIRVTQGPPMIRTENAQLAGFVFIDMHGRDLGGYVEEAARAVRDHVRLPPGYRVQWSGQYEFLQRAVAKLRVVVPAALFAILVLLYFNFGRLTETLIVILSVPFALAGGIWLMWGLGYNLSVAVAVGFIALAGVAAETGVVMLIYLDLTLKGVVRRRGEEGRGIDRRDLEQAITAGAVERVRPKMMTVTAIMAGLLPILWSHGTGAEVMRRIAVPMVGGMVSSALLTLLVIPAIYVLVKGWKIGIPIAPGSEHR
jgi:copper/silver efflux system protein